MKKKKERKNVNYKSRTTVRKKIVQWLPFKKQNNNENYLQYKNYVISKLNYRNNKKLLSVLHREIPFLCFVFKFSHFFLHMKMTSVNLKQEPTSPSTLSQVRP